MINFLGFVIFATIIVLGTVDGRKDLNLLALYRPPTTRDGNPPTQR